VLSKVPMELNFPLIMAIQLSELARSPLGIVVLIVTLALPVSVHFALSRSPIATLVTLAATVFIGLLITIEWFGVRILTELPALHLEGKADQPAVDSIADYHSRCMHSGYNYVELVVKPGATVGDILKLVNTLDAMIAGGNKARRTLILRLYRVPAQSALEKARAHPAVETAVAFRP